MSSTPVYEPFIHTQSVPASVWNVNHGWGRPVGVKVYGDDGVEVDCEVEQIDTENVRISFYENSVLSPVSGMAVII